MTAQISNESYDLCGLKAPFPWFGGKSRAAKIIWDRFGNVPNYVEPFAGSLAVLLSRPHSPKVETVNDLDCYLANFWRAIQSDPYGVAEQCDWPVNEADLNARHWWLINQAEFRERIQSDPDYYDAKIAGRWVYGICAWIGSGWCELREAKPSKKLPHLGDAGRGVHRPSQQLPHLSTAGMGVHRPHLGNAGMGVREYLGALSERLRRVRVACGDWSRVLGKSALSFDGARPCGVLLDPPYDDGARVYAEDHRVSGLVRDWALAHGDDPNLRIALCGYEGEHAMPDSWECVAWKAKGGYGSQRAGNNNAKRERIWFSPACLRPTKDESSGAQLEIAAC